MAPQLQPPVTAGKGRDFDIIKSCLRLESVMVLDGEEYVPLRTLRRDGSLQDAEPHEASTGPTSNSLLHPKHRSLQASFSFTMILHQKNIRLSIMPS